MSPQDVTDRLRILGDLLGYIETSGVDETLKSRLRGAVARSLLVLLEIGK